MRDGQVNAIVDAIKDIGLNLWLLIIFILIISIAFMFAIKQINNSIGDIETRYIPNCQEDEVIYYDNYPDGNLICIHFEEVR